MSTSANDVLRQFGETTSIKGISRIVKAQTIVLRTVWTLVVVSCLGILIFSVYNSSLGFVSHSVNRILSYSETGQEFPDVTICNINPYAAMASFSMNVSTFQARVTEMENLHLDPTVFSSLELLRTRQAYIVNSYGEPFVADDSTNFSLECNYLGWNAQDYKCGSVQVQWSPLYHKCFTITTPVNASNLEALQAILYIDDFPNELDPYIAPFPQWGFIKPIVPGVLLTIQAKGTQPDIFEGVVVSPGSRVTAQLSQMMNHRISEPYGDCVSCYVDPVGCHRSQSVCFSLCRQRAYIDKCGCLAEYELTNDELVQLANGTYCMDMKWNVQQTDNEENQTLTRLVCYYNFWADNTGCNCPWPCKETTYQIQWSQAQWPHAASLLIFYNTFIAPHRNETIFAGKFDIYDDILQRVAKGQSLRDTLQELDKVPLIQKNFIYLNIVFDGQTVTTMTETPTVTWDQLVGTLGGALNLWAGISIFFVAEVVELIFALVNMCRNKCIKDKPACSSAPTCELNSVQA